MLMLFLAFIRWWYGDGWLNTIKKSKQSMISLAQSYSISMLLRTLFSPWKQLNATPRANMSMNDRMGVVLDKLISRFVGFMVRFITLTTAGISLLFMLLARAVWIAVWPAVPLLVPGFFLYGLGMF